MLPLIIKYYEFQSMNSELFHIVKELPEQWVSTKKLAVTVKQQVAPLQATEVAGIRKKIATFDSHVSYYREVFKRYDVSRIYESDYYIPCRPFQFIFSFIVVL